MRSIVKLAAPAAAAALLLAACGTTGGDDLVGVERRLVRRQLPGRHQHRFLRRPHRPEREPRREHRQRREAGRRPAQQGVGRLPGQAHPYDSQGDQNQAQGLAQQVVGDSKVVGIVGPAFSGESKVADPIFAEAGIVGITPSATNPNLAENGWKTFFRVLGNDATQGPAAAKFITGTLGKQKVYVVDDSSEYGKGLADIVRKDLGAADVKDNTIQTGQTDFSAVVADIRASGADAVFFGGYYAEGGLLLKQMRDAGLSNDQVAFISDDGAKDDGLITAAGADAANGAYLTCPCLPPDKAEGSFVQDYTTAYGTARRRTRPRATTPRRSCSTGSPRARSRARTCCPTSRPTTSRA